jgi:hypothetical protein
MKTSELAGMALDYWVAMAEGKQPEKFDRDGFGWVRCKGDLAPFLAANWAVAGPIIARERITLLPKSEKWTAMAGSAPQTLHVAHGVTPQLAAMRAYLLSRYGTDVIA